MEEKKIRLVVTLYPQGAVVLSCTDVERTPPAYLPGKASTQERIPGDFEILGLKEEAEVVRRHPLPKTEPVEIPFTITETQEIMEGLGFREIGAIDETRP